MTLQLVVDSGFEYMERISECVSSLDTNIAVLVAVTGILVGILLAQAFSFWKW